MNGMTDMGQSSQYWTLNVLYCNFMLYNFSICIAHSYHCQKATLVRGSMQVLCYFEVCLIRPFVRPHSTSHLSSFVLKNHYIAWISYAFAAASSLYVHWSHGNTNSKGQGNASFSLCPRWLFASRRKINKEKEKKIWPPHFLKNKIGLLWIIWELLSLVACWTNHVLKWQLAYGFFPSAWQSLGGCKGKAGIPACFTVVSQMISSLCKHFLLLLYADPECHLSAAVFQDHKTVSSSLPTFGNSHSATPFPEGR